MVTGSKCEHAKSHSSEVVVRLADALAERKLACLLAEVLEELCNLVGIHAGSRHLNGSRPVEVVVAQVEGELLNDPLLKRRIIEGDEVVSGEDATLSSLQRHNIEVVVCQSVFILDDVSVNEST